MKRTVFGFLLLIVLLFSACQMIDHAPTTMPVPPRYTPSPSTLMSASMNQTPAETTPEPIPSPTLTAASEQEKTDNPFVENKFHPIVIGYLDINDYMSILGGSSGSKWYSDWDFQIDVHGKKMSFDEFMYYQGDASGAETDLIKGEETFKFYGRNGFVTTQACRGTVLHISEATGGIDYGAVFYEYKPEIDENYPLLIGINGDWDAQPRILEKLDENTYLVDLEGDGKRETFKTKTKTGILDTKCNRKYDETTLYIAKSEKVTVVEKYPFYSEDQNLRSYQIYAFDLNGDGKLEIVTMATDDLDFSVSAYEYQSSRFKRVLGYVTSAE